MPKGNMSSPPTVKRRTFVPSYLKFPQLILELWCGQADFGQFFAFDLDLEPTTQFLRVTRLYMMVNICPKLFLILATNDRVTVRTRCFWSNFSHLTLKFDHDLWRRQMVVVRDTPSHYGEHLCQVILNSLNKWQRYTPDKHIWMDGRTHARTQGRTDCRTHAHTPNRHCGNYVELTASGLDKNDKTFFNSIF